jgi:hypothetical protein
LLQIDLKLVLREFASERASLTTGDIPAGAVTEIASTGSK